MLIRLFNSAALLMALLAVMSGSSFAAGRATENALDSGTEKRQRVEQREKMRGEMRQAWANMTAEERDALRREHPDIEDTWGLRARSDARVEEPKPVRHTSTAHRPLSPEEHHHLRRQLRDLSQEERR